MMPGRADDQAVVEEPAADVPDGVAAAVAAGGAAAAVESPPPLPLPTPREDPEFARVGVLLAAAAAVADRGCPRPSSCTRVTPSAGVLRYT